MSFSFIRAPLRQRSSEQAGRKQGTARNSHALLSAVSDRAQMAGLAHSTISAMRSPRPRLPLLWLLCSALLIQSASARRSHHAHKHGHGRKGAVEEFSAANADPHIYRGATAKPLPNPLPVQDMPGAFTWCDTPSGRSFCGPSWNQHIPASVSVGGTGQDGSKRRRIVQLTNRRSSVVCVWLCALVTAAHVTCTAHCMPPTIASSCCWMAITI